MKSTQILYNEVTSQGRIESNGTNWRKYFVFEKNQSP